TFRIFEQQAIEPLRTRNDRTGQFQISVDVSSGRPFQSREQCQYVLQIVKMPSLLGRVRFGRELLNFVMSTVLALRKRSELGLRNYQLFVRPTDGDELADKWNM